MTSTVRVVAALSYAISGCFALPELERRDIMRAGYLADIGMEVALRLDDRTLVL